MLHPRLPAALLSLRQNPWSRRVLRAGAALLLLWLVAWLAVPPALRWGIERLGSQALGRSVAVGSVDFRPWSLELTLHELAVGAAAPGAADSGPQGANALPPQFTVDRVYLDAEMQSLLRLAPVVDALTLESPHLRLAHQGGGHYDIDDILERLATPPDRPDTGPARLALYNLVVSGGTVDFADAATGSRHTLRDLALQLPFLSTLPSQRTVEVQPHLAFRLDDSTFDSRAHATPFAEVRQGEVTLRWTGLDLADYKAYLPTSLPLQVHSAVLAGDLTLAFVQGPERKVALRGSVQVSDLRLNDRTGQPLFSADQLAVDLTELRPLEKVAQLGQITLKAPVVHASRQANGQIHGLQRAPTSPQAPAPAAAPTRAPSAPGKPPAPGADKAPVAQAAPSAWKVEVAQARIREGQIHWKDQTTQPAAVLRATDLALEVRDIAWPLAQPLRFEGQLALQDAAGAQPVPGGTLQFQGEATGQQAQAQLTLKNLGLPLAAPYLAAWLEPTLEGQLSGALGLQWQAPGHTAPGSTGLSLTARQLTLDQVALRQGGQQLGRIGQLALSGVQLPLDRRNVSVDTLTLTDPDIAVERDRDGRWMVEHWLKAAGSPAPAASSPTDPAAALAAPRPWRVALGELQLNGGRLAWKDALPARPVAFGLSDLTIEARQLALDNPQPSPLKITARLLDGRTLARVQARPPEPTATAAAATAQKTTAAQSTASSAPQGKNAAAAPALSRAGPAAPSSPLRKASAPAPAPEEDDTPRANRQRSGQFAFEGNLRLAPLALGGKVEASRLPLHALDGYLADRLALHLVRALAGFRGHVDFAQRPEGPALRLQGDAALDRLQARSTGPAATASTAQAAQAPQAGEELLAWESLGLRGVNVAIAPRTAPRIAVQETSLANFYARVVLNDKGQLNLAELLKPAPGSAPGAAPSDTAPSAPDPLAPVFQFGPLSLVNGQVLFSDFFIRPNYRANLTELTGKLSAFSSVPPSGQPVLADLELRGKAEGTASLEITGQLNPLAKPLALDIQGKVRDLELSPLTPYAIKYAGHGIESGKLSLDVAYTIQPGGQLTARNQLVLNQLTFGDPVEGAPNSLPVRLAASLLADRNGVINLDLPLSGSLNDPEFRIGPILFQVIVNLIGKALVSPFALLASALGGGDELDHVAFAPGSAELSASARRGLDKVVQALTDRPSLQLAVTGQASLAREQDGLRRAQLDALVLAEKRRRTPDNTDPVQAAEYPGLLRAVYRNTDMPKPRNLIGLAKDLPQAEMEALLRAYLPATDTQAGALAQRRALAVQAYLAEQKLPASRLQLTTPQTGPQEDAWTPRAQLSLSMP